MHDAFKRTMKKEIDKYIGNKIYEIRTQNNWSRRALVNKIGGTEQQLSKYEKGVDNIPISKLLVIAKVFQVSIEEFFPKQDKKADLLLDDEELVRDLINNYTKIKDIERRKAFQC